MKKLPLLLSLSLIFSGPACSDVATDLDSFFNDVGFSSNTTNVQAFESQASGFFGGGSVYARTPIRNYRLVTLDLPDYRAGCGGIDLFTGSMSFISGEKLKEFGVQVMKSTGAYSADIILSTTVPQLKYIRDNLQATVQKLNQTSINSCEMAQNLVGGLWPKTEASQEKICTDQRRMGKNGVASDYVAAHMDCAGFWRKETMDKASNDDTVKKQVVMNKNLVWSLLQDTGLTDNNQELAELMMSLTGSVIIDADGKVTQVPSLLEGSGLIETLLGISGTEGKIWHCTEKSKCMKVNLASLKVSEEGSLTGRVRSIIRELDQKLKNDEAFSDTDKSFLAMTSLPVLKFLVVLNSTQYASGADIESYSTLIATEILQKYLSGLLQAVNLTSLGSSMPEELMKDLRGRIEVAMTQASKIEPNIGRKFSEKMSLIENVARIEKQLASSLGGQA